MKKNCLNCGVEFDTINPKKTLCCKKCHGQYYNKGRKKEAFECICNECGKTFIKYAYSKPTKKNIYCSQECVGKHKNFLGLGKEVECPECGESFPQKHSRHKYCSNECKRRANHRSRKEKEYVCSHCGKIIWRKVKTSENVFCSKECEKEYKYNLHNEIRDCEECGKPFSCKKSEKLRFCSTVCQSKWQSEYRVGENSSNYNKDIPLEFRVKPCECCGKEIHCNPSEFEKKKFCSVECARRMSKKTMTFPHKQICGLLEAINVEIEIEKKVFRFGLDIYLPIKNLAIEVMGTFWHCDKRIFPEPKSVIQKESIVKDSKKDKRIRNEAGMQILYLWEYDICNRLEVCESLILEYIESNGILPNYHSMNYDLNSGSLKLIPELITAHFEDLETCTLRD